MKTLTHIVLVAVILTGPSLCGAESVTQSVAESADFKLDARKLCNYATMAAELRLTDEQVVKIERILKDMDAALAKWDKTNRLQIASLRQDEADCRKSGDTATLLRALNRLMVLSAERRGLAEPYRKLIRGVLDTEQRAKWEGYLLDVKLVDRFRRLGLTDDQKTQIRTLCDDRGGTIADMRDRDDRKGVARAESEVNTKIIDSVLTEDQRVKLRGQRPDPSSATGKGAMDLDLRDQKGDAKKKGADKGKGAQGKKKSDQGGKKNKSDAQKKKEQDARRRKEQDARRKLEARNRRLQQDNRRRQATLNRRRQEEQRRRAAEAKKKAAEAKKKAAKPAKKPSGKKSTK